MGYVFGKAFWWLLAALVVGGFIGWMLNGWRRRSWTDTSTVSNAASASNGEVGQLKARVANLEPAVAERDTLRQKVADLERALRDCESSKLAGEGVHGFAGITSAAAEPVSRFAGVTLDLDQASAVLGETIKVDDLKVVEGIGPKIEELMHGGGITTWAELADSPIDRLQEILDGAGERYRVHNPATWPRQAELLAFGRWEEFRHLTNELTGGRE
jgi:predicted flap endonuclease-1-like 5' DNA nuclease